MWKLDGIVTISLIKAAADDDVQVLALVACEAFGRSIGTNTTPSAAAAIFSRERFSSCVSELLQLPGGYPFLAFVMAMMKVVESRDAAALALQALLQQTVDPTDGDCVPPAKDVWVLLQKLQRGLLTETFDNTHGCVSEPAEDVSPDDDVSDDSSEGTVSTPGDIEGISDADVPDERHFGRCQKASASTLAERSLRGFIRSQVQQGYASVPDNYDAEAQHQLNRLVEKLRKAQRFQVQSVARPRGSVDFKLSLESIEIVAVGSLETFDVEITGPSPS